jgi:hypothetical protein
MLERNNSVPLSSFVQAQRLARVERGFVIKACVRGTMRRFVEWLRVLGILRIRLARDLAAKRVLRSAIRELHQLDLIGDRAERQRLATNARAAAAQLPTWQDSARLFADAIEIVG